MVVGRKAFASSMGRVDAFCNEKSCRETPCGGASIGARFSKTFGAVPFFKAFGRSPKTRHGKHYCSCLTKFRNIDL
jgi:hypothetical protein